MPVEFFTKPDDPGGLWYKEKPLTIDEEYARKLGQLMDQQTSEHLHDKGFSKDRNLRYAGQIPKEVWWNKIRETDDKHYWQRDRGKNMKRWLNENNRFRIGGQL